MTGPQIFSTHYPADWDPTKHSSVKEYHKSKNKPSGVRPKKVHSKFSNFTPNSTKTRFELEMDIICHECHGLLKVGHRFDARKFPAGEYYNTPIWGFKIFCKHCTSPIVIHTDPKTSSYICESGATIRPRERGTNIPEIDQAEAEKLKQAKAYMPSLGKLGKVSQKSKIDSLSNDPFYLLEKSLHSEKRHTSSEATLLSLQTISDSRDENERELVDSIRKNLRAQRKKRIRQQSLGPTLIVENDESDPHKTQRFKPNSFQEKGDFVPLSSESDSNRKE